MQTPLPYTTELQSYTFISVTKHMNSWHKVVGCTMQNFKNGIAMAEPFETVIHDLTFEEIGQLCGGN